jgi:hypothetical protein
VIALDTQLLVYAHRRDSPFHRPARARVAELAEAGAPWAIPWPCLHEFYAIVTHPRIYDPPSTASQACDQIDAWLESPGLVLLAETHDHWHRLRELCGAGRIVGPRVHDARVAAICLGHGVRILWSVDRDFSRFPGLRVVNPLV